MSQLEVTLVPQLADNYSYIMRCRETGEVGIVDCPEAEPMIALLNKMNLTPNSIWLTHHHWDHINGTPELLERWPDLNVYAYQGDSHRLDNVTQWLEEGDKVELGNCEAEVIFTPGHTSGHIAYYFAESGALFCGDTMFAAGCGRVFEGTFPQMHESLQKLGALPPETKVYCGHEYTASNVRFALSVDPDNTDLQQYQEQVTQARSEHAPTIPTTLELEWKVNPFLRVNRPAIQQAAEVNPNDPAAVFEAIRRKKDNF